MMMIMMMTTTTKTTTTTMTMMMMMMIMMMMMMMMMMIPYSSPALRRVAGGRFEPEALRYQDTEHTALVQWYRVDSHQRPFSDKILNIPTTDLYLSLPYNLLYI